MGMGEARIFPRQPGNLTSLRVFQWIIPKLFRIENIFQGFYISFLTSLSFLYCDISELQVKGYTIQHPQVHNASELYNINSHS
jgi:hypothetical protein